MPATSIADLFGFDAHVVTAYSAMLTGAGLAAYALSNADITYPSVGLAYAAGEPPLRYITPTTGPLAGRRLQDQRPGEMTFELRSARGDDDHPALLALLLATLEDATNALPALLPYYAVVEARQLAAPLTMQDDRETVTTLRWRLDLFILPSAVPT